MVKSKEEEIEISILTEDQINELPQDAVESVRILSDDLATKQLRIFIPVVQQYIELRDLALTLKLEKGEDGEVTKESIQAYKDLKKATGSFNSELTKNIKKIKDPLNDTKSKVISVEKTFKSESDKIKEKAEKLFQEYEDEVARKKQEAIDKKNAALNAKIKEAEDAAAEMQKTSARSQVLNDIKYKETLEGITQKAADAVNHLNETQIKTLSQEFSIKEFSDVLTKYDTSALEQTTIDELTVAFNKAKEGAILTLNSKLKSLENERELAFSRRTESAKLEDPRLTGESIPHEEYMKMFYQNDVPTGTIPPPPIPGSTPESMNFQIFLNTPSSFFVKNIENVLEKISDAIDLKIGMGATPELAELRDKFNQFNS